MTKIHYFERFCKITLDQKAIDSLRQMDLLMIQKCLVINQIKRWGAGRGERQVPISDFKILRLCKL